MPTRMNTARRRGVRSILADEEVVKPHRKIILEVDENILYTAQIDEKVHALTKNDAKCYL